jgi:chromosome segregation ATPase
MKNIKTYTQYLKEDLEPLKDKLADNTNTENKSDDSMNILVKQIEQVSTQIEAKKLELNKNLENLEKLQIDNFTDQNKEYAEKTKKDIQTKVDALNGQIENLNKSVELFKKQLEELKKK